MYFIKKHDREYGTFLTKDGSHLCIMYPKLFDELFTTKYKDLKYGVKYKITRRTGIKEMK